MEIDAFIKKLITEHPSIAKYGQRHSRYIYLAVESYLSWYLSGAYPVPLQVDPLARWPGDGGPLYTVLDGKYGNNFLHQHGDLAFKQQQICRHIAHYIARQTIEPPHTYSKKDLLSFFSENIASQPRRVLIVTQRQSRAKHWLRVINQGATMPGHPGYLQQVMQGETDLTLRNAIGILWDAGGVSIQQRWQASLLGTGLKQFLTEAAADQSVGLAEYQAARRRYRKPQLDMLATSLRQYRQLYYRVDQLQSVVPSTGNNHQVTLFQRDSYLLSKARQSIKNLLGAPFKDHEINAIAGIATLPPDQSHQVFQQNRQFQFDQRKDDLPYLLAVHEALIKLHAARCLFSIGRLVEHVSPRGPIKPFFYRHWDVFSFCIPVICTHVADVSSLLDKFGRRNYFPLVIIDQQGEDYAPESLLPCINMSHSTLFLAGE